MLNHRDTAVLHLRPNNPMTAQHVTICWAVNYHWERAALNRGHNSRQTVLRFLCNIKGQILDHHKILGKRLTCEEPLTAAAGLQAFLWGTHSSTAAAKSYPSYVLSSSAKMCLFGQICCLYPCWHRNAAADLFSLHPSWWTDNGISIKKLLPQLYHLKNKKISSAR